MANHKDKLFNDFPAVTTEAWIAKITEDLKGADYTKKMIWKTNEGFSVNPFYRSQDLEALQTPASLPSEFPYVRGARLNNKWYVRQNLKVTDVSASNQQAKQLLSKGVNSLGFKIPPRNFDENTISLLLQGIDPEVTELNFSTCHRSFENTLKLAESLSAYFSANNFDLSKCKGSIEYNPFGVVLKKGKRNDNWADYLVELLEAGKSLPYRLLNVGASLFSDSGAYIYQELGYALAQGNEIVQQLNEKGIAPSETAKRIKFGFGISSNYFMEIAKFRAARWLWAEILKAWGVAEKEATINVYATTSTFNTTVYDHNVNLLRTQTEAMSATIAGVDSLTILPFDCAYSEGDEFSQRIARNQQLLLKEECHFDAITDASAGSYYIENLTASLAGEAWKLFVETADAGFYNSLLSGTVQSAIGASGSARFKALATRREILLGTNQYPNFSEKTPETAHYHGDTCTTEKGEVPALSFTRLASEFEILRQATEQRSPRAFMLTIGDLAMRLARSQFSSNFFACAGYSIIDNLGFETLEEGFKKASAEKADVVVLCSSDAEYPQYTPQAVALAKESGKLLVIAGGLTCQTELQEQGAEHFISIKSNVLESLKQFNSLLKI